MSVDSDTATGDEPQSVEALAQQLGEAIQDLPEYEMFVEAKEAVEADEEAQEKIKEFEQLREEFMLARQTGDADNDDLRQLQEAQQELHEIPAMSEFQAAQSELELRLQEVNETISESLAFDFGQKAGGCCED